MRQDNQTTQEQKRIKLAEAAELFRIMPLKRTTRKGKDDPNGVVLWYCSEHMGGAATYNKVPDYFTDLDAVHELEKVLTYQQHCLYCDILEMIVGGPAYMPAVRASAAHRCEALGKTLNLW
jgi:hypothetical protein